MRTATSQGGRLSAPAENLILLAFAAVALMIAAASAYMLLTNTQPKIFFLAYACVPVLCILVGAAFLPERRPGPRVFLLLLFTAGLALKGITALTVTPKLESDFYLLHYAAEQLAQGNNGLAKSKYLTFGIESPSMRQAKPRLKCKPPDAKKRPQGPLLCFLIGRFSRRRAQGCAPYRRLTSSTRSGGNVSHCSHPGHCQEKVCARNPQ